MQYLASQYCNMNIEKRNNLLYFKNSLSTAIKTPPSTEFHLSQETFSIWVRYFEYT